MVVDGQEHERQRFEHLVLERPRPKPVVTGRRIKRKAAVAPVLAPDIEARVALREDWRGMAGTPDTYAHVAEQNARAGALARLVATGAIDAHQLAAAEEIALAYSRTVSDVAVRTAAWQVRYSVGRSGDMAAVEGIHSAILDLAYTRWRAAAGPHAAMLLAMIVDDIGVTIAARNYRMSNRRARAILIAALDRWRRV